MIVEALAIMVAFGLLLWYIVEDICKIGAGGDPAESGWPARGTTATAGADTSSEAE